ncbi:MAG: TraB/GumN family protein, partial [Chitinophagaceae bacterium]|nr:TraB/GumN family protein [Chitinophagaceae bacterium]
MKRTLALIPLFFLLITATGQTTRFKPNKYPSLFWEISGNGLKKPSYLFGTMHVRDNKAFDFSDSVLLKIDACEAFALEVHPD